VALAVPTGDHAEELDEPVTAARPAGLHYVDDSRPGIHAGGAAEAAAMSALMDNLCASRRGCGGSVRLLCRPPGRRNGSVPIRLRSPDRPEARRSRGRPSLAQLRGAPIRSPAMGRGRSRLISATD
jgi:hypothetical protein